MEGFFFLARGVFWLDGRWRTHLLVIYLVSDWRVVVSYQFDSNPEGSVCDFAILGMMGEKVHDSWGGNCGGDVKEGLEGFRGNVEGGR